jgi:large subunit ribosomal protein L22
MEVRAVAKYVRVQPRKVRIIADEVRGKAAPFTLSLLRYHPSKSAKALRKVLVSAMANAEANHGLSADSLQISAITVDEGPRLKRIEQRAMGRGNRIVKKMSHITVVVTDVEPEQAVKPHGTKAKPRPTFGSPSKGKRGAQPAAPAAAAPVAVPVGDESPTPGETTDTAVEEAVAVSSENVQPEPEEATPVTESDAPEEGASTQSDATPAETTPQAEGSDDQPGGAS